MPRYAAHQALSRVIEGKKSEFGKWKEGLHLERSSGRTLEELRQRGAADRWSMANALRRRGDRMVASTPPFYGDAVSRYYYSMYHAMRAVVFFVEGGDDYEKHSALPSRTPADFVNAALWQNALKDARERRNAADYEPYPKSDAALRRPALELQREATDLVALARDYLRGKGCGHL